MAVRPLEGITIAPSLTVADGIVDAPFSKFHTILPVSGSTAVSPFDDCNSANAG